MLVVALTLGVVGTATAAREAAAQETGQSLFRDPDDGAFDISAWLATPQGFLPIVRPVTEPALGLGVAGGVAFIHRPPGWNIDQAREDYEAERKLAIPSISAGFGMYTDNKSWMAGLMHLGIWRDGRLRYQGSAFASRLNLAVEGHVPGVGDRLFEYQLEGWGLLQSLRVRMGGSDWFAGILYNYLDMESAFRGDALPDVDLPERRSSLSSVGASLAYDDRSNAFTPDRGVFANLEWRQFMEAIGSDFSYGRGQATVLTWLNPVDEVVLGLRAVATSVGDGAPFWARPSVSLRGVAAGQYAGKRAGEFEAEVRWDVVPRWSGIAFGGAGWYRPQGAEDDRTAWVGSGGVGFRYLLARAFGLRGGTDFAWSRDGFAFYITMGSAWPTF